MDGFPDSGKYNQMSDFRISGFKETPSDGRMPGSRIIRENPDGSGIPVDDEIIHVRISGFRISGFREIQSDVGCPDSGKYLWVEEFRIH